MTQFTSGARSVRPSEPRPLQRGSPAVFYQAPPTPTPHPLQVHFGCYRAGGWVGGGLRAASDAVHEAAREQAGPAVALQRAFEPAVLPLPVHEHDVALLELQLGVALRRVRHHHPVPAEDSQRRR